MKKSLSPEQKLIKAIFGTLHPTDEQIARVEDELYAKQTAPLDKTVDRSMLFVGWCNTIMSWHSEHGKDRKYVMSDSKPMFSLAQAVDMAQIFYRQGREDSLNDIDERCRLIEKKMSFPISLNVGLQYECLKDIKYSDIDAVLFTKGNVYTVGIAHGRIGLIGNDGISRKPDYEMVELTTEYFRRLEWAKEREAETRDKAGTDDVVCAYHDAIMDLIEKIESL